MQDVRSSFSGPARQKHRFRVKPEDVVAQIYTAGGAGFLQNQHQKCFVLIIEKNSFTMLQQSR